MITTEQLNQMEHQEISCIECLKTVGYAIEQASIEVDIMCVECIKNQDSIKSVKL